MTKIMVVEDEKASELQYRSIIDAIIRDITLHPKNVPKTFTLDPNRNPDRQSDQTRPSNQKDCSSHEDISKDRGHSQKKHPKEGGVGTEKSQSEIFFVVPSLKLKTSLKIEWR